MAFLMTTRLFTHLALASRFMRSGIALGKTSEKR
jgi:hypothetical protein